VDRQATSQQQVGTLRSSIAWALLGLVIERPSYGYELIQRFRRTYGETLVLSGANQIYTALDQLKRRSLIEEVSDPGSQQTPARRPKPHYRATEDGMHAYEEWLLVQIEEERQRQRMFARQLAMLEPKAALEVIDRYEEECLTDAEETSPAQTEREGVANRLADQDEQLTLEARLSWIRYAREELADLQDEDANEEGKPR
jgi:DNA-binding PadR family transcriptional regulator